MALPRPSSPRALWADIKAFGAGEGKFKLMAAGVAIVMPALMIAGFYVDSKMDKPKAKIFYVPSFAADRTDAEIIKQNIADQKELDARREAKRLEYQRLADRLGIK